MSNNNHIDSGEVAKRMPHPDTIEDVNFHEWLYGEILRRNRGIFRDLYEGGSEIFLDEENSLFLKYYMKCIHLGPYE